MKKFRILIVNGSPSSIFYLKQILIDAGYEVLEAATGRMSTGSYLNEKFDLVLIDINMPEKDGIKTISKILQYNNKAIIIALSSCDNEALMLKVFKAGAVDFICKSIDSSTFLAILENHLHKLPV